MRTIGSEEITRVVSELCLEINFNLSAEVLNAISRAQKGEESLPGKEALQQLLENARLAGENRVPLCQDTGLCVVFIEIGQEVVVQGNDLHTAVNRGVAEAYQKGYLRKSVVKNPLTRENTGDNTPAVLHVNMVKGTGVKITVAAKGGGSENMSALKMLPPSAGREGIIDFVVQTVESAGPNPCPPLVIGVGIGGNFETAPLLAKKALLRAISMCSSDPVLAGMEEEILNRINRLGIGPQGFGGRVTALSVSLEAAPCHIASLPAAVNIDCHCHRHACRTI